MPASGFSRPSATFVCSAEYVSPQGIETGEAPIDLNIDVHNGLGGTRILKPFRSSGVRMGLATESVWRKPLSQTLSNATRFALLNASITCLPSGPSIADQTLP